MSSESQTIQLSDMAALLIASWHKHQQTRPQAPEDYLANIDHLRIQMDRWQAHDSALRAVIADQLLQDVLSDG